MLLVELKPLIARLNTYTKQALEDGVGLCVARGHYEITVEHVLLKLSDGLQADMALLLRQCEIDVGALRHAIQRTLEAMPSGNTGKPTFSPLLLNLLQDAWLIASVNRSETQIRSGAMVLALLTRTSYDGAMAANDYTRPLRALPRDTLAAALAQIADASLEAVTAENSTENGAKNAVKNAGSSVCDDSALTRYCENFTAQARAGRIDPVFGRDHEIRQMVDILARRRKNNPLCVGDPGVGKTAVVEGLALRIVDGDVPAALKDVTILGLDMGLLQAGASVKGEFESRLNAVIAAVKASATPIILFIDEVHTLIGAGGAAGTSDAANLLKPALARGELRTIAATTWSEYKRYVEKDAALARRFQLVKLDEPDVATAVLILRGLKPQYETAHQVLVCDDALIAAAEMSARFIPGRRLPDKAVDLLDTACARVKVLQSAKPDVLEDKERCMQALQRERAGLQRDRDNQLLIDEQRWCAIDALLADLERQAAALRARWLAQQAAGAVVLGLRAEHAAASSPSADLSEKIAAASAALAQLQGEQALVRIDVDRDVIAKVVSDWTGIPVGKMLRDQAAGALSMAATLKARIRGQDHAMQQIADVLKIAKSGLGDPQQPLGVFLLAGPSGVGKTETALAVADLLFGAEQSSVVINMSEFQEKHNVSRLIGAPPGYVGYGEGGVLTEAVRQRPYSVLLLDEVEKAHLDVLNLFYQVFDKGVLSDGEGKQVDFSNTVIFLTSNLGSDLIAAMPDADGAARLMAVRPLLSAHFKPALLARMTVIPYATLASDALACIVRLKLDKIVQRLASRMRFSYSDAVVQQIAARCTEVETGARNIDFIVKGNIMPLLSQQILCCMRSAAPLTAMALDVGADGDFLLTPAQRECYSGNVDGGD